MPEPEVAATVAARLYSAVNEPGRGLFSEEPRAFWFGPRLFRTFGWFYIDQVAGWEPLDRGWSFFPEHHLCLSRIAPIF